MEPNKNISSNRLEKIKKMHEVAHNFLDSLVDITGIKKDDKRMVTPDEMETFLILSLDSSAIITANSLLHLFQTIKDKEEKERAIAQILKQFEGGLRIYLSEELEG
jgi:hypothetical protein